MAANTYGDISQRTAAYAATEMLAHAEPILVLSKFGLSKPLPKNTADTVKFRRPIPFTVTTAPLVEGATPTSQAMRYEDVTVQLQQYGDVTVITDKIADLAEDPVLMNASMLAGEQAAEKIEMITWGAIKAGTNVFYDKTTHSTRASVDSKITLDRVRAVVRNLQTNRGKPVTQMLAPSPNYATKGIEGGYIAFAHTDMAADIRQLTGFKEVASYGSRQPLCPEELGSVENVRFIVSPLLLPFVGAGAAVGSTGMVASNSTNIDVYPLIMIAKDAYGLIPLKGANAIAPMILNPGVPRGGDPLGQVGTVGTKYYFAAKVLNEKWLARLEVGVSSI